MPPGGHNTLDLTAHRVSFSPPGTPGGGAIDEKDAVYQAAIAVEEGKEEEVYDPEAMAAGPSKRPSSFPQRQKTLIFPNKTS